MLAFAESISIPVVISRTATGANLYPNLFQSYSMLCFKHQQPKTVHPTTGTERPTKVSMLATLLISIFLSLVILSTVEGYLIIINI